MAAQGIVAGIRQGCDLLRQGQAQIKDVKKAVEEAQAFAKEAKSLWSTLKTFWASFFGGNTTLKKTPQESLKAVETPKSDAKKSIRQPVQELSYEEFQAQAIHDICEQLKKFFEIKRQLKDYCRKLEEESKTTADIEGAALDRIQIEMQLEQMTVQIRETMIYTPKEIGLQSIYSRFLSMYEQILEEREFDRQLRAKQERDARWQREYRKGLLLAKLGYATVLLVLATWMTGLFSAL